MVDAAVDKTLLAKIALSVVIYCISVSAVPIWNKKVFSGNLCWSGGCAKSFPFPITTAFLQLGLVSIVLGVTTVVGHLCSPRARAAGDSWIFGPYFRYKLRHIAPVGLLFGVKYGITNWGLALVPTAKHLLLQSTDLVWTVVLARVVNKERLGFLEGLAVAFSVTGAVLISLESGANMDAGALGLVVNLLTPIFLALCITTLRTGAKELFRRDNCLGGSMSPFEFTAIKLALSSSVALALACLLENATVYAVEFPNKKHAQSWWVVLGNFPQASLGLLLVGSFFILIFQVNITWLAGMTSATAVGVVGEVKVVPQWFFNALFSLKVDLNPLNLWGAGLSILGSVIYACSSSLTQRLVLTGRGFQWRVDDNNFTEKLTGGQGLPEAPESNLGSQTERVAHLDAGDTTV